MRQQGFEYTFGETEDEIEHLMDYDNSGIPLQFEIKEWLYDNIGYKDWEWSHDYNVLWFRNEQDAMQFKLRWL